MATFEFDKKKVLGRGLASLIPDSSEPAQPVSTQRNEYSERVASPSKKDYFLCDIEKIVPNTYQPRKIFDKSAIEELSQSIKEHGVIQPILVRKRGDHYELIAGERRWRASQKAGLKQIPVIVKEDIEDKKSLEIAIIENVQREGLNCIEEALAYQQLIDEFQLSQEEVAQKVAKNRVTVSNTLRLLKLSPSIREDIVSQRLTMGHARALLALDKTDEQIEIRNLIIKKKLSVRETEKAIQTLIQEKTNPKEKKVDIHLEALEKDLREKYKAAVRIVGTQSHGFLQFSYSNREELMRLADMLKG